MLVNQVLFLDVRSHVQIKLKQRFRIFRLEHADALIRCNHEMMMIIGGVAYRTSTALDTRIANQIRVFSVVCSFMMQRKLQMRSVKLKALQTTLQLQKNEISEIFVAIEKRNFRISFSRLIIHECNTAIFFNIELNKYLKELLKRSLYDLFNSYYKNTIKMCLKIIIFKRHLLVLLQFC